MGYLEKDNLAEDMGCKGPEVGACPRMSEEAGGTRVQGAEGTGQMSRLRFYSVWNGSHCKALNRGDT